MRDVQGAELPAWPYAIASGSQRLALLALLNEQPAGSEAVTTDLAAAQGFVPDDGMSLSWTFAPGLVWDENLNGGIAADSLRLYGLEFVINEESRAKSGLTPTLTFGVAARKTLAPGAVVQIFSVATAAHSFEHRIGKTDLTLGICAANSLDADWFTDICLRQTRRIRELGNSTERVYSLGFEKLFGAGNALHSVTIRPQIEELDGQTRPMFGMDWIGIYPDFGVLSVSLLGGEQPVGYAGVTRFASIGLKRDILGALTGLSLSAETSAGQRYLGLPRIDDAYTIRVTRPVGTWGEAQIGYRKSVSSIVGFSESALLLGLDFKGWGG